MGQIGLESLPYKVIEGNERLFNVLLAICGMFLINNTDVERTDRD